jgi:GTP-binding protein
MSQYPAAQFLLSVAAPPQFPPDTGWELAMAGRSNAGKSSAINAILARKAFARTSKTPGRTQQYNYFELQPGRRMVDLPGYGHASVSAATRATWGPLADALQLRQSFQALMLVVDSRRGLADLDLHMLEWANQPVEHAHVLLSKADKLSRQEATVVLRESSATLNGVASCQLFSAHSGQGVDEARAVLRRWLQSSKEIAPAE